MGEKPVAAATVDRRLQDDDRADNTFSVK